MGIKDSCQGMDEFLNLRDDNEVGDEEGAIGIREEAAARVGEEAGAREEEATIRGVAQENTQKRL